MNVNGVHQSEFVARRESLAAPLVPLTGREWKWLAERMRRGSGNTCGLGLATLVKLILALVTLSFWSGNTLSFSLVTH